MKEEEEKVFSDSFVREVKKGSGKRN